MPAVFNKEHEKFEIHESPVPEFVWRTTRGLSEKVKSKYLKFEIRSLDSGKFSYPYHFHRNAEEIFVILSGRSILRTPDGFNELKTGDIIFMEMGPAGAHQLYNNSPDPCVYLDIATAGSLDICEYPDSGKLNILPYQEVYETAAKVNYYRGEEKVRTKWPEEILKIEKE
jgi:uncharacterized cupin superfamily protein